jgi:hypothetical protein
MAAPAQHRFLAQLATHSTVCGARISRRFDDADTHGLMQDERGTIRFLYIQGSQHYAREHHITERDFSASPVASDLFDVKDQIHRYDTPVSSTEYDS